MEAQTASDTLEKRGPGRPPTKKDDDPIEEKQALTKPKQKTKKVRVHRSNVDPDNKDVQISVCVNTAANRKIFWPGEEVELTESQIGALKIQWKRIEYLFLQKAEYMNQTIRSSLPNHIIQA